MAHDRSSGRHGVFLPIIAAGLMSSASVKAQAQIVTSGFGTRAIDFGEVRSGGRLIGCELDFDQLLLDTTGSTPHPVFIVGAVSWLVPRPGHLGLTLHVLPKDISTGPDGTALETAFDPALAYATFGTQSTAGREAKRFRCENGGFCAITFDAALLSAAAKELRAGFSVAYQRSPGSLDVQADVNMPTPDQPETLKVASFSQCVVALVDSVMHDDP